MQVLKLLNSEVFFFLTSGDSLCLNLNW